MKLYSIFDKKSNTYGPVFVMKNNVYAIREFQKMCEDENTMIKKYPEDFKLIYLGEMNEETGVIKQPEILETLAEAANLTEKKQ